MDDIGPINEAERLADIMVRDQHANPALLQMANQLLDIANGNRVNAGKGFVEQHEARLASQGAGNFTTPPLTAGQGNRGRFAQALDIEFLKQGFERLFALVTIGDRILKDSANIVFDIQPAKNRGFLREITNAKPCAAIHGQLRDFMPVKINAATIRSHKARDHIKNGGLARAIRPEQADRFTATHRQAHILHDLATAISLSKARCDKPAFAAPM